MRVANAVGYTKKPLDTIHLQGLNTMLHVFVDGCLQGCYEACKYNVCTVLQRVGVRLLYGCVNDCVIGMRCTMLCFIYVIRLTSCSYSLA